MTRQAGGRFRSPAFVEEYNTRCLHSAIGYVTPHDRLSGRHEEISAERDRKLKAARARRAVAREAAHQRNRVEMAVGSIHA